MDGRTEDLGLAGVLTIDMGGAPVTVRALTIEESDAWLDRLAVSMAATEVLDGDTSEEQMRSLVTHASAAALDLVLAYDMDGVLGGRDAVRKRMTKRELAAALEQMVTVEDPLAEDAARTVRSVFGLPAQLAAERMEAVTEPMLRLVTSLSTLSERGASTTPATSGPAGPASSSSSTGPTRKAGTRRYPKTAAS